MLVHELQIPLKDFLFSFSTQSYILISQAKIRAREVYQQILYRSHDLIALSKKQSQDLFKEVSEYFLSLYDEEGMEEYRGQFVEHIREIFGTDSLFLSDFYYGLADELDKRGQHEDSLEFAGRALVVRMKLTGIMSEKTGESHIQLGTVYFKIQYDEEAKRELYAGRIVLAKIHNEESLLIANVDCMIGESEMRSFNYLNAFVAFQRCYRTRYFALGAEHYSTALAKRLLNECRDISGTRYYCGMELKDRIYELQWLEYNQRSQQNIVAIFINRMADDVILTSDQLENVVHTSFSFHENLTNSLMKKDARYNMEDFEHTITVQEVLLLLATQSPPYPIQTKPVLPTSPPGESKKTSAAPTNTISKLLNSSKGVERPKQLTPARASSFTESKTNENRLTSTSRLGLSSPKHISNTAPSNTNATSGEPNAVLNELQSLSVEDSVVKSQSETETKKGEDAPLIRIPSELSIKDTAGSGATTPSSSSSKQRTWRKIPMSSPLRRAANPNAGFSNIDLGDKNYHIARSDASGLIFVRKCSADVLRQAIRSKVLAVGLFAWYCGGRTLASKAKQKAGAAEGGDANSALNALFGKKGAPPSSDNNAGGSLESKEDQPTNGPKFAKSAPRPPPVPTSWPPIPFTPDEAKTDAAAAGGDDKDGDAPSDPSAPPKPKLKQVFLTSLASIEGTFWSEPLESFIAAEELFDDIEEEFAIGGPKKQKLPFGAASKAPPKAVAKAAKPTETVLDPQRGQNINIMLAKFGKKSLESIAEAVISMEAQALGASVINVLLQFIPTPDEIAKVTKFVDKKHVAPPPPPAAAEGATEGSTAAPEVKPPVTEAKTEVAKDNGKVDQKRLNELKIGKAEQFIFHMSKIKVMDKRLTAMSSILTAQEMQQQVINQSEILLNAVGEVRGCSRLKFILKTCLDLNNTLANYSKTSTTMTGISISSWGKLSQVKLNSGETAQQYIVNKLMSHIPEALELANDMPSIDEARTVQMTRLGIDVKKLEETLTLLQEVQDQDKKQKENIAKCDIDEKVIDLSLKNLEQHLEQVKKLHLTAKERFELAQKDFVQLVAYFGEASPPIEPEAFFGELSTLCKGLQTATAASTKQRRKAVGK